MEEPKEITQRDVWDAFADLTMQQIAETRKMAAGPAKTDAINSVRMNVKVLGFFRQAIINDFRFVSGIDEDYARLDEMRPLMP